MSGAEEPLPCWARAPPLGGAASPAVPGAGQESGIAHGNEPGAAATAGLCPGNCAINLTPAHDSAIEKQLEMQTRKGYRK